MFILNITHKVDPDILQEWKNWMQKEHIPAIMDTGLFTNFQFSKVLFPRDEEGASFAIQLHCQELRLLQRFQAKFSNDFHAQMAQKYGTKCLSFRTVLELQ